MQVSKWVNSLAVRIPAHIVRQLDLQEGDNVETVFSHLKRPEEALQSLKTIGRKLPKNFRFERPQD
ncbi:AbrB/MazE/SpoVT family DNA-binding domain-containing protein [Gluconobacter sp. P5E10]|uniref:AbrB/MazE/SpoVT family DNA-binding domain-containing protein n=1 Tax=Gluconobacter sp. P5E10 TaxID=2762613 RepID=UPI001C042D01|nr:AbrB/MazE/SpoVT family DNA-binding domain-containing protein [Gluconobacter sp. P5E10]